VPSERLILELQLKGKNSILIFDQTLSRRARPKHKAIRAAARHIPQRLN
jgi:hypothetical protein